MLRVGDDATLLGAELKLLVGEGDEAGRAGEAEEEVAGRDWAVEDEDEAVGRKEDEDAAFAAAGRETPALVGAADEAAAGRVAEDEAGAALPVEAGVEEAVGTELVFIGWAASFSLRTPVV